MRCWLKWLNVRSSTPTTTKSFTSPGFDPRIRKRVSIVDSSVRWNSPVAWATIPSPAARIATSTSRMLRRLRHRRRCTGYRRTRRDFCRIAVAIEALDSRPVAFQPKVFGRKWRLTGAMGTVLVSAAFASPALASGPSWLSPVKLSADGSDAATPVIAMDGNGDSDAVWAQGTGTLQTSYRQAGPGDPFVEQDVGGSTNSSVPDVAEDGGGDAEAVWIENSSVNWSYRTNDIDGFGGASGIKNDSC